MFGGKSVEDEPVREKIVDAHTYSVTLDDVQSFTAYDIRIAGVTKRGEGVYSKQMVQGKQTSRNQNKHNIRAGIFGQSSVKL